MLKSVLKFVFDNIGNPLSSKKISDTMTSLGRKINSRTVEKYLEAFSESYIIYPAKRYNIKGKEYLKSLEKYYIVDIGLRNFLLGFRNRDSGHAIENVVYFELLRRGYDVAIGKADNREVDFVATKMDDRLYVQVTESMVSEDTRRRELAPLQKISDNYEKIVLSLEPGLDSSYEGIKSISLISWLVGGRDQKHLKKKKYLHL